MRYTFNAELYTKINIKIYQNNVGINAGKIESPLVLVLFTEHFPHLFASHSHLIMQMISYVDHHDLVFLGLKSYIIP